VKTEFHKAHPVGLGESIVVGENLALVAALQRP
jgi:hypothetical protein